MTFSSLSVLYVEDEVIVALETAETLRELGFSKVCMVHTLRAAEQCLARQSFDVALLDVNLGNGERTTSLGKGLDADGTRVFFASGYNKSDLGADLQRFDFLEKPATKNEMAQFFQKAFVCES